MTATARPSLVPIPPDDELGPAMMALTPARRAFVCAMVERPGIRHYTENAMRAGYGNNDNVAQVAASRMMRTPAVLAAIREEADRRLKSGALIAASKLIEMVEHPDARIAFKASVELLNRAGLIVETQHKIVVEDNRDLDQLRAEVQGLFARASVQKTLPSLPAPVDAEFVEVEHDPNDISDLMAPV